MRPETRKGILDSRYFLVLGTRNYLQRLREAEPNVVDEMRLAKSARKPTILALHALSPEEEKELSSYFAGHEVAATLRAENAGDLARLIGEQVKDADGWKTGT